MADKQAEKDIIGVGRRKTAVSSVRVRPGAGVIDINGRSFEEYFPLALQREAILAPLNKIAELSRIDLIIRVKGGGIEAQVIATRLGISRALVQKDEGARSELKAEGYLTRDPRKKERKKYGRRGARRSFQFSKR